MQAKRNANDAIALVNTAEGGLAVIQDSLLMRMRELAVQSANDTLVNDDRDIIQLEIEQLKEEINHIANHTEYNTIQLLNVDVLQGTAFPGDPGELDIVFLIDNTGSMNPFQTLLSNNLSDFVGMLGSKGITDMQFGAFEYTDNDYLATDFGGSPWTTSQNDLKTAIDNIATNNRGGVENVFTAIDNVMTTYTFRNSSTGGQNKHIVLVTNEDSDDPAGYAATLATLQAQGVRLHAVYNPKFPSNNTDEIGNMVNELGGATVDLKTADWGQELIEKVAIDIADSITDFSNEAQPGLLKMHIGANTQQTIDVELFDATTKNLGLDNLDLSLRYASEIAIRKIDRAIQTVSEQRAKFGLYANRLEHAVQNISVGEERMSQSESQIRDADIATEMMNMTKNRVLMDAAQGMLSQTFMLAEKSLQLLRA
jgi:flagellin